MLAQQIAAEKWSFIELADPSKTGFEWRRGLVDFVPVEAHTGFQAQSIARPKPARQQARRLAEFNQVTPKLFRVLGIEVDLESVLTRITRAGDQTVNPGNLAKSKMVVANRIERARA